MWTTPILEECSWIDCKLLTALLWVNYFIDVLWHAIFVNHCDQSYSLLHITPQGARICIKLKQCLTLTLPPPSQGAGLPIKLKQWSGQFPCVSLSVL